VVAAVAVDGRGKIYLGMTTPQSGHHPCSRGLHIPSPQMKQSAEQLSGVSDPVHWPSPHESQSEQLPAVSPRSAWQIPS